MDISSPDKVAAFKEACMLANQGHWQDAYDIYCTVFEYAHNNPSPRPVGSEKPVLSSDLIGLTEIYKADCLGYLGRFDQAKKQLEEPILTICVNGFVDLRYLWHFYFVYGNVLGALGDIAGMDDKLSRALKIAAESLGDAERCQQSWFLMMACANKNQAWQYLLDTALQAKQFAINDSMEELEFRANECIAYAHHGLNDIGNARMAGQHNLEMAKKYQAPEAIERWQAFLSQLPSTR